MADKLAEGRMLDAADLADNDKLQDQKKRNDSLLAEIDPENTLNLAGVGVLRLTMAGLTGHAFESAVSIMRADRHTSLDEVLELVKKKK